MSGEKTTRPKLVDKYLRIRRMRLKAQKWESEHAEKMKEVLRESTFPDVYLQYRTSKQANIQVMEAWCKQHLSEEELKSVYVSVLDPNAFLDLLKSGICTKKKIEYPKNLFKVTISEAIAERKVAGDD